MNLIIDWIKDIPTQPCKVCSKPVDLTKTHYLNPGSFVSHLKCGRVPITSGEDGPRAS